ncbi:MAG: protein kinase [Myxococcota bacterium]|nr:protein kinase [Myxococcota bacterium]MDW8362926.1 protein kinase [Myxococcales bacterium]
MESDRALAQVGGSSASPAVGETVGGRFQVLRAVHEDAIGSLLEARDVKSGNRVALRIVSPALVARDGGAALRAECRLAARLEHPAIAVTYGVGALGSGAMYVAAEWIDGVTLSSVVARRRGGAEPRTPISLRGACDVLGHVCHALQAAHATTCHGALRTSTVWLTRSGRVKVSDWGVARAVVRTAGPAGFGSTEQAALAPEVKAGGEPTPASDVFGLGAVLYELLTLRSPAEGFVPPSQVHPEASADLDAVLLRALSADPARRFGSAEELHAALVSLAAHAPPRSPSDDFGIAVEPQDASRPAATPPKPPPTRARIAPVGPAAAHAVPVAAVAGRQPADASLGEQLRASLVAPEPGAADARASSVDLGALLERFTANDAPRWMVVKDNLDHGPFSGRELIELIARSEVLGEHGLLNMDTGERRKVRDHPDLVEFLEQARLKREREQQARRLAESVKVEKASNVAKIVIAVSVLAVLGVAAGVFVYSRRQAQDERVADAELADLYERGEIELTGTAGILPDPPRRRGGGASGVRRPSSAGGLSYEEAMMQGVDIGDVTRGGGERRLTPADVAGVMNRHINSFFGCVGQEIRRGGRLGQVTIDLAILGEGTVQGVSVRPGSEAFQSCVAAKVRTIRFPRFEAPRMGARFSFVVD